MAEAMLDHLVVAASTIEQGVEYIRALTGVEPGGGGRHTAQGTHNKLLKLSDDCYLEVIAIDPHGEKPGFPRWFDLDSEEMQRKLKTRPRLITWVARTDHLETLMEKSAVELGSIRAMGRGELNWKMTFTEDGAMPGNGLIPPLIQWDTPVHPARGMMDSGCSLVRLEGYHIDPDPIRRMLESLGLSMEIEIKSVPNMDEAGLKAYIMTPNGIRMLC